MWSTWRLSIPRGSHVGALVGGPLSDLQSSADGTSMGSAFRSRNPGREAERSDAGHSCRRLETGCKLARISPRAGFRMANASMQSGIAAVQLGFSCFRARHRPMENTVSGCCGLLSPGCISGQCRSQMWGLSGVVWGGAGSRVVDMEVAFDSSRLACRGAHPALAGYSRKQTLWEGGGAERESKTNFPIPLVTYKKGEIPLGVEAHNQPDNPQSSHKFHSSLSPLLRSKLLISSLTECRRPLPPFSPSSTLQGT